MIVFNHFGRAGNFLFQCAAAIGYAKRHGIEYHVPQETHDNFWNPTFMSHLANANFNKSLAEVRLNEQGHDYNSLPFIEEWRDKNIRLNGYFQSEKYFKEFREDILDLFRFDWRVILGTVAIHVRRGDYVNLPTKHPVVTNEYISKAITFFNVRGYFKFMVFSDGLPWARININSGIYPGNEFKYMTKNPNPLHNMQIGSCCEHQISSNGTYGWWMAWLNRNPNKMVVCVDEENWFGPENKHNSAVDIIPPEWMRIPFTPIYQLPAMEQEFLNKTYE